MFNFSRRTYLIARRDYLTSVRSKTFLIGLVIFPVMFGGGAGVFAVMKARPDLRDRHVALIDRSGKLADFVVEAVANKNAREMSDGKTGVQISPRYIVEPVAAESGDPAPQRLALSNRVRGGALFGFIDIGNAEDVSVACYTNAGAIDRFQPWVSSAINEAVKMQRLTEAGIGRSRVPAMLATVPVDDLDLLTTDAHTGAIQEPVKRDKVAGLIVPMVALIILFMIVMLGCAPMLSAVTEDKSQRIAEMLLGIATPHELMMGKVMSGVARSLTGSIFYLAVGTVALIAFQVSGLAPVSLLPWFYVYLVAEVTMLCAFSAALGASCNTPQEAQNLVMLVMAPIMIPLFVMVPVLDQPNGLFATAMSLIPLFTPMLMFVRQTIPGGVPAWQPWVGLLGVLACALAGVWAAGRVFRIAILVQGQPPRLADMVRWAIKG
jgi:ABC-2 type transport system permease protein